MGPTVAAAATTKLDLPIVFLTRAEEPRLPLAFVDPVVEDPGVWARGWRSRTTRPPAASSDRKSTRLNSSHYCASSMPPSACNKKASPNIHATILSPHYP